MDLDEGLRMLLFVSALAGSHQVPLGGHVREPVTDPLDQVIVKVLSPHASM